MQESASNKNQTKTSNLPQAKSGVDLHDPHRAQAFLDLFQNDRRRLYSFIYTIVGDKTAADDIFQESSMVLWREFDKFEPGTRFAKWANAIAFNRIREYWRSRKKQGQLFEDSHSDIIADQMVEMEPQLDQRWDILSSCMTKLREVDQLLFNDFYARQFTAAQLAEKTGRSIFAIRKSIHKIRRKLFDCVDKNRKGSDGSK